MVKKIVIIILIAALLLSGIFVTLTLTNELYTFINRLENKTGYRFYMTYRQGTDAPIYADCSYRAKDDAYAFRFALQQNFQLVTYRMAFVDGNRYRIVEPSSIVSFGLYSKKESEVGADDNVIYKIVSSLKKIKWLTGVMFSTKSDLNGKMANRYEVNANGGIYVIWFRDGLPVRADVSNEELGNVTIELADFREEANGDLFKNPEQGLYIQSEVTFDFFFGLFAA